MALRRAIVDLDPKQAAAGTRRLLGIIPFGDRLRDYFAKYRSAQKHIDDIIRALKSGQDELRKDNAAIEGKKANLWESMTKLQEYATLAAALDAELQARIDLVELTDPDKANALRSDALFGVRQKHQDLLTQLAVSAQGYLALDLVRKNNLSRRSVATSERILAYLGSLKNIVGSALALGGLGLHFLGLAGSFWPVVVAGLYGVGSLLTPPDRVRLTISHAEVEARALRTDLDTLVANVSPPRFPEDVVAKVGILAAILRDVLARAEALTSAPDHLHVVSQAVRDYLPTSLEAYANLPRSYALTRRGPRERSAHEELMAQLGLLESGLSAIAEAVYQGDEQALRDQGRFLRDRFGGSSLDL
ncbi:toxic anion resistance protein [Microbispora sp. H10836]|uniref:toxic anion resistance protein n=1 Tax=Microbispora sp. H10836 TaxID=2729106 RepID=UPI001B8C9529|nr:toxic anion resistance protein [Microbispora sp. H10836]